MSCTFKDREDMIEKYLLKELPETEMNAFEEHYLGCNECFGELESTKQMMELIRNEGEELFPEFSGTHEKKPGSYFNKIIKKYFGPGWYLQPSLRFVFAAALILVVIIYVLNSAIKEDIDLQANDKIVFSEENTEPQADNIAAADPVDEASSNDNKIDLYAANFNESSDMEYLIKQNYRSNGDLDIISPPPGKSVQNEILFKWNYEVDEQLLLKILNNEEEVVYKTRTSKRQIILRLIEEDLEPGVYYWKLENEEELLYLGKFYLKQ